MLPSGQPNLNTSTTSNNNDINDNIDDNNNICDNNNNIESFVYEEEDETYSF